MIARSCSDLALLCPGTEDDVRLLIRHKDTAEFYLALLDVPVFHDLCHHIVVLVRPKFRVQGAFACRVQHSLSTLPDR